MELFVSVVSILLLLFWGVVFFGILLLNRKDRLQNSFDEASKHKEFC